MTQPRLIAFAVVGALLLMLLQGMFFTVQQYQYALVTSFGKPVAIETQPGLKFKVPFIQAVEFFDGRILEYNMETPMEINASDQKRIVVDAFLKWQIDDPLKFAQTTRRGGYGADRVGVMNDLLRTIFESSLRNVLGRYPLNALLSPERAKMMAEIRDLVTNEANTPAKGAEAAESYGVKIIDVRIVRADLPKQNSEAIFRRMQTERDREAKQFRAKGEEEALRIRSKADRDRTVLIAEAQKRAETLRGEGDGEAAKIYAEAFGKDPSFYEFYRTMQAYQKSLSQGDTTAILSPDSEFLKQMEGK